MTQNYERLVEVFVKADLRDEIKSLKKELTYDQFLRNLIKKNRVESSCMDSSDPNKTPIGLKEKLS